MERDLTKSEEATLNVLTEHWQGTSEVAQKAGRWKTGATLTLHYLADNGKIERFRSRDRYSYNHLFWRLRAKP